MADILNIPNCGGTTGTFNSGIPLCDVLRKQPLGLIGLDAGVGFTAGQRASLTAFLTELRVKVRAARGSRAYPMWALTNYEDKTKEPTKAALGNLTNGEITTADGIPAFGFQHRVGELFHKKLMEAQSAGLTWLIVDSNYVVYGTLDGTLFRGFTLSEFYVGAPKFGNQGQASVYPFDMTLASMTEFKENLGIIQASSSIAGITGIRDVALSVHTPLATNVIKVALTAIGGTNIAKLFATELVQSGVFTLVKDADGSSGTVTATYDSTNEVMSLTLGGTPWSTGTTGQTYKLNLAVSSVLAGLASPIDGYESTGALTVTKP